MKTTIIDRQKHADAPVSGAFKVWWYVNDVWVEKGWLMPENSPQEILRPAR